MRYLEDEAFEEMNEAMRTPIGEILHPEIEINKTDKEFTYIYKEYDDYVQTEEESL